jgi:hypothetical protein
MYIGTCTCIDTFHLHEKEKRYDASAFGVQCFRESFSLVRAWSRSVVWGYSIVSKRVVGLMQERERERCQSQTAT